MVGVQERNTYHSYIMMAITFNDSGILEIPYETYSLFLIPIKISTTYVAMNPTGLVQDP